jgi:hypothetical protein
MGTLIVLEHYRLIHCTESPNTTGRSLLRRNITNFGVNVLVIHRVRIATRAAAYHVAVLISSRKSISWSRRQNSKAAPRWKLASTNMNLWLWQGIVWRHCADTLATVSRVSSSAPAWPGASERRQFTDNVHRQTKNVRRSKAVVAQPVFLRHAKIKEIVGLRSMIVGLTPSRHVFGKDQRMYARQPSVQSREKMNGT